MPVCKNCGETFPLFSKDENGKRLDSRRRSYCLKCNPLGQRRFWRGKLKNLGHIEKKEYKTSTITCKTCGRVFLGFKNLECPACRSRRSREERREKAYNFLGGKCIICEYDRCKKALAIHHLNKEDKKFTLSNQWGLSWATIEEELKKCVLLCCRCHAEVHDGITKLS